MLVQPEWLVTLQLALRLVTSICAFIGLGTAWLDWCGRNSANSIEAHEASDYSYLPMFAMICLMTLFLTPVTLSSLVDIFSLPPIVEGSLRSLSMIFLLVYFFYAMVLRLRAYNVPKAVAVRQSAATLLAMTLLAGVGVYGAA